MLGQRRGGASWNRVGRDFGTWDHWPITLGGHYMPLLGKSGHDLFTAQATRVLLRADEAACRAKHDHGTRVRGGLWPVSLRVGVVSSARVDPGTSPDGERKIH